VTAPGQVSAKVSEQQKKNRDGDIDATKKWRPHRDFAALHPFGENRKQRAPQHREAGNQQKKIIEQETRFARNQRLQPVFALQVRAVLYEKEQADGEHNPHESQEPASDGRLRESV